MNMESRIFLSFPHLGGTEMNWIEEAFKGSWVVPLCPNVAEFEKQPVYGALTFCNTIIYAAEHIGKQCACAACGRPRTEFVRASCKYLRVKHTAGKLYKLRHVAFQVNICSSGI